ncbi:MAG: hypothetical protein AB1696_03520 [Planctomycetota bacterium]
MRSRVVPSMICVLLVAGCVDHYTVVPVERTPYDREWEVIRKSMDDAARLEYHRRPGAERLWQSPAETAATGKGDCTALATFLYYKMLKGGVRNGRIVFGFMGEAWHAWVEWRGHILDPTTYTIAAASGLSDYRPCWGYEMGGKYRYIETAADTVARQGEEDRAYPAGARSVLARR